MKFNNALNKRILFFDGGTGSVLQSKGLIPGERPEVWNITHADIIEGLHYDYFAAGANIIKSNTFGANRKKFPQNKYPALENVILSAMKNAVSAREKYEAAKEEFSSEPHFIALDIGPTGKLIEPLGDLGFEDAVELFSEVVRLGERYADLILIETMNDLNEARAAVIAAKENSHLPIIVTTVYDERGKTMTGSPVSAVAATLEGLGVSAMGSNCSLGPTEMVHIFEEFISNSSCPIVVNPNAGLPRFDGKNTYYDVSPDEFAITVADMAKRGASLVGGCCGTTPYHIRALRKVCKDIEFTHTTRPYRCTIASRSKALVIGDFPLIIGERVNPTGKPCLKEALRKGDFDYIANEGILQEEAGAHILDVNVGLPEIDEVISMSKAVRELEDACSLPLQIDSNSPAVLEAAMRKICGKTLINSVSGKSESMDSIFPLVKKYGGVVVALTLDENGIPKTAEGRLNIVKKILKVADKYGIRRSDILFDPLAMTVSSDIGAPSVTLDTLCGIKALGCKTVMGVSNISFGLPKRELINSTFFAMALERGLDAAIINPLSYEMMRAYRCYLTLRGYDKHCSGYIEFTSRIDGEKNITISANDAPKSSETELSFEDAIRRGRTKESVAGAEILLEKESGLEIINNRLIPALEDVGRGFEEKTVYLPELLMSAEAAKAAFEVIKRKLGGDGSPRGDNIVIATVKGDIHDIGKNIVRVLLENYGYNMIDLGKDVPADEIVRAAKEYDVRLVCLSALMTTTVPAMEETIKLLRREVPHCKVAVGGAVMTQEYADMIGADYYCKDAMQGVRVANKIFGN